MHHLIRFGAENIPAGTVFSPNPVTAQRNEREEEENKPERSIKFFNLVLRIVSVIAFAVELLADPSIKPYASKTLEIPLRYWRSWVRILRFLPRRVRHFQADC